MNKHIFFILVMSACYLTSWAQNISKIPEISQTPVDTSWKTGFLITVSFNQTSLTNWAAGGQNSIAGSFIGNFFANYNKGKNSWNNTLDLAYGFIENGASRIQKNLDRIELNSKYGYQADKDLFYSCLINAKTQFAPGYNYPNDSVKVSDFAAPAYVTAAIGMDYMMSSWFSLFISPATGRLVIVTDQQLADQGQFGVTPALYDAQGNIVKNGQEVQTQFGAYLRARLQKNFTKTTMLMSTLALFNDYTDPKVYQRKNINVDWQTTFNMKITKLLTFNLFTQLLYDNNIKIPTYGKNDVIIGQGPKTQFMEALGLGISYALHK
jgi:hypothetical protein